MRVQAHVADLQTKENLEFATVLLLGEKRRYTTITDNGGRFYFRGLPKGTYEVQVSFVGYNKLVHRLTVDRDTFLMLNLIPETTTLGEVVVTATESKGLSSSSRIDRRAMEHLQPSGFADLLELLPGGMSKDPVFGKPSLIRLREAGSISSNYDISSLGTAFYVDGAPVSGNANMQYLTGNNEQGLQEKDITGKGLDMRGISTDEIERVDVVRGIPSVEYGDLTSGLVKIGRRAGATAWNARFKADSKSKLFYAGKGFEVKERAMLLNFGLDYLDSKTDPRDNLKNYKRITGSVRLKKNYTGDRSRLVWNSNLDYTGGFDREKKDPDLNHQQEDSYRAESNRLVFGNNLVWTSGGGNFQRSLSVYSSLAYQQDLTERVRFVQLNRDTPIPNSSEEGEHDGLYLPYRYTASHRVDGKPLTVFLKAVGVFGVDFLGVVNNLKTGAEWNLDKNFGRGQLFDAMRPVYPSVSTRTRAYRDVPAGQYAAFFAEDAFTIPAGAQRLNVAGGVRAMSVLNLGRQYRMRGKVYWDPRVNAQWCFPALQLAGRKLEISLNGGIGWHTKLPVLAQLYPDDLYVDLIQLNYFHTNPDYRRLNILTRKISPVNTELEPARNRKLELRLDLSFRQNQLSVTWFREELNSGFRDGSAYKSYAYKKYDNHSVDAGALQGPPELSGMTYKMDTVLQAYGTAVNGSRLLKEGVEFQFASQRLEGLQTRLTINGAWFRTTYQNSLPVYRRPSIILEGKQLPYLGLYASDEGYVKEQFNTNFIFDTDVPQLGLNFSASVQCLWHTASQRMEKSGIPLEYVNVNGDGFVFTEADKVHKERQWLVEKYNAELFRREKVPMAMQVNFKATKRFYNRIDLALFVNGMLDYYPDYDVNGHTVRRYNSPYFGMELNLKI